MKKKHGDRLPFGTLELEEFVHVLSIAVVYISGTGLKWRIKDQEDKLF